VTRDQYDKFRRCVIEAAERELPILADRDGYTATSFLPYDENLLFALVDGRTLTLRFSVN
jgi:hypothetical protein